MNNIMNSLKRFFKNKNTVTILGVVVVLALLYWGYSSQIKGAVNPVTIPVAAETIPARTQITASMITNIQVSSIAVSDNVYRSANAVIGKYTNVNTIVPEGSMFFKEAVIDSGDFKDSIFDRLEDNEIPYLFSVNMETTYGNSIYPAKTIDIYMKALDETGKVIVGKLIEDVNVLAVRDANGRDVFESTTESRTPAYLVFALTDEIHILMRKADYITSNSIELFPVPHGGSYTGVGETKVSTEYLKDFINSKSIILEGQETTVTDQNKNNDQSVEQ